MTILEGQTTTATSPLIRFRQQRHDLVRLFERERVVVDALGLTGYSARVRQLGAQVEADTFKVLVIGEFNRGKSTVINAILGNRVLPAYSVPTTAIINEVKYGSTPRARLYYMPAANGARQAPRDIPVHEIEQHVRIPKNAKQSDLGSDNNPYEKVELFWPLELCRDGVELVDSPGLNENEKRANITMGYLQSADAVIFTVACDFPVSDSEIHALESIRALGYDEIFFICNRINMIAPEERGEIIDRCYTLLAPFTSKGNQRVFFVNALGALDGRREGNRAAIEQSGMLELERDLKDFLVEDRGRVKIKRPGGELRQIIRESIKVVAMQEKTLPESLEVLKQRQADVERQLNTLEKERDLMIANFRNWRAQLRDEVHTLALAFYGRIATEIPGWAEGYTIQQAFGFKDVFSEKGRTRVVTEVTTYVAGRIKTAFAEWRQQEIDALISSSAEEFLKQLNELAANFALHLTEAQLHAEGGEAPDLATQIQEGKISAWNRVLSAAGGILVGDIYSGAVGAMFGWREMLKSLIPQLAIGIGVGVMSAFNPLVMIPLLLGSAGIQAIIRLDNINKRIKEAVGREYAKNISESRYAKADQMAATVYEKLGAQETDLRQALNLEIQTIRDQMNAVVHEKEQGQMQVAAKLTELGKQRQELEAIQSDLENLMDAI